MPIRDIISVGSANNNKLSLTGMQLPENHKANFDVSSEGSFVGKTRGLRSKRQISLCN